MNWQWGDHEFMFSPAVGEVHEFTVSTIRGYSDEGGFPCAKCRSLIPEGATYHGIRRAEASTFEVLCPDCAGVIGLHLAFTVEHLGNQ